MLWGLVFLAQDPQTGEPGVGLRSLTPVGEPLQCNYSPVCGSPTLGDGTWLYRESASPACIIVVPSLFMSSVIEDLFW